MVLVEELAPRRIGILISWRGSVGKGDFLRQDFRIVEVRIDHPSMRTHVHIRGTSSKKTKKLILCDVSGFGSSPKIENFYPGGSILFEFTVKVQDSRFKVQDSRFKKLAWTHLTYACTYVQRTRDKKERGLQALSCSKPSSSSADAMRVSGK